MKKKIIIGLGVFLCGSILTACHDDDKSPIVQSSVTAHVEHSFPITSVSNLPVRFVAKVTNQGVTNGISNAVNIVDLTYPEQQGLDIVVDTNGGVGPDVNCFDPQTDEGASLSGGQSCFVVLKVENTSGQAQNLVGDIEVIFTGAKSSALKHPIQVEFLAQNQILAKTGQTSTAPLNNPPEGSDGDLQKGVDWDIDNRFDASSADFIRDELTGLTWEKAPSNTKVSWYDALNACNTLELGGLSDWRLPNVIELASLLDMASSNPANTLNSKGFSSIVNDTTSAYWSSTSYAGGTGYAYLVMMYSGGIHIGEPGLKENQNYVLCVHGDAENGLAPLWQTGQTQTHPLENPPQGSDGDLQLGLSWSIDSRYIVNGDETVTDTLTGLMWQQDPSTNNSNAPVSWSEALDICNALDLAGHVDWYLPNRTELFSMTNYAESDATETLNQNGFANVRGDTPYWSSTTSASGTGSAWTVKLAHGTINTYIKTDDESKSFVWCVREID